MFVSLSSLLLTCYCWCYCFLYMGNCLWLKSVTTGTTMIHSLEHNRIETIRMQAWWVQDIVLSVNVCVGSCRSVMTVLIQHPDEHMRLLWHRVYCCFCPFVCWFISSYSFSKYCMLGVKLSEKFHLLVWEMADGAARKKTTPFDIFRIWNCQTFH